MLFWIDHESLQIPGNAGTASCTAQLALQTDDSPFVTYHVFLLERNRLIKPLSNRGENHGGSAEHV
jgi:hypothetical protein